MSVEIETGTFTLSTLTLSRKRWQKKTRQERKHGWRRWGRGKRKRREKRPLMGSHIMIEGSEEWRGGDDKEQHKMERRHGEEGEGEDVNEEREERWMCSNTLSCWAWNLLCSPWSCSTGNDQQHHTGVSDYSSRWPVMLYVSYSHCTHITRPTGCTHTHTLHTGTQL